MTMTLLFFGSNYEKAVTYYHLESEPIFFKAVALIMLDCSREILIFSGINLCLINPQQVIKKLTFGKWIFMKFH